MKEAIKYTRAIHPNVSASRVVSIKQSYTSLFLPYLALLLKKAFGTRSDLRNLYAYKVIEGSLCNIRDSGQKQISAETSSEICSSQTTQLHLTHREIPIVHDGKILPSMRRLGAYHQLKEDALCGAGCGPPPIIIIRENYHLQVVHQFTHLDPQTTCPWMPKSTNASLKL